MQIEGLVLESKFAGYQQLVKGPMQKVWRDGFPVDEQKVIPLQFERYLLEVDQVREEQEWTADEVAAVERQLDRLLRDQSFRDFWVHEKPKVGLPWPTYDETAASQIVLIATATGTLHEALTYETRGRETRPEVVAALNEQLGETIEDGEEITV